MEKIEDRILTVLLLRSTLENAGCYEEVYSIISEAQKEAWNEAIELAAKEAKLTTYSVGEVNKNSILKLKK